jgi:receptor family ligand binding protein
VVATLSGRAASPCPDPRYGCVEVGADERLVIGTLFPEDRPGRVGVEALVEAEGALRDHPLEIASFDGRCSAEAAAHAARELATQPPEGYAVVGVIGEACPEAEITAARILDESGIVFVSVIAPSDVPRSVGFYLEGPARSAAVGPPELSATDRAAFTVARNIREAVARVAVRAGDQLLVPRTQLRNELLGAGLTRAS